jgi:hypothetical protein
MKYKILNVFLFFSLMMTFGYLKKNRKVKQIILDNYSKIEEDKDFKSLIYKNGFKNYKVSLYNNVVFD